MNTTNPSGASAAKAIDTKAADWLQRRHFWEWSVEDEDALQKWLAESLAHRAAYLRLADIWNRTERLQAVRQSQTSRRAFRFRTVHAHMAMGVAALIVLAAGLTWNKPAPAQQSYATSIGGRETIVLVDGSQIDLNTDTEVRVAKGGRERMVWLDRGEAYFEIRHDTERPFVVIADGHRITDLGTKFVVRKETNRLKVSLVEGRASVEGPRDQKAVLAPGDVAVATEAALSISKRTERVLALDLGWRRGVLTFNHTTLSDAVAEFNRYNHTQLVVASADAGKRMIYGTFPTTDVVAFTRVIQAVFGLKVAKHGEQTIISQ